MESQSINDFLKQLHAENIDTRSRQAADRCEPAQFTKPIYSSRVGLYQHLEEIGLHNESPLFSKLFDHFGQGLKLK